MTVAVCFNCGEMKFGSLTECDHCGIQPETDHDKTVSIHLTDWIYSSEQLEEVSEAIKSGVKIQMNDEAVREWGDKMKNSEDA